MEKKGGGGDKEIDGERGCRVRERQMDIQKERQIDKK